MSWVMVMVATGAGSLVWVDREALLEVDAEDAH